jgi:radical SAM superfamily enzyme YgiQ (UPF0313 family)
MVQAANHELLVYDADYDPTNESYNSLERLEHFTKYLRSLEDDTHYVWQEVRQVIQEFNPDFLGLTIVSATLVSAIKVIKIAKEIKPEIKVIVGGVHPTLCPEECIGIADYVVQNEGEMVILDILDGKVKKGIVKGTRISNLDQLPLPAISCLYNLHKYHKRDLSLVISTRGCPNNCKFCNSPQIWGRKVTRKSVSYLINEIANLNKEHGVTDFFISDDSFTYHGSWLEQFCFEVKKLNITWRCLARIDQINEEMVDKMFDAGCRNIKFGIESGSQRILDQVNKGIKVEDVYRTSKWLGEKGVNWSAFFMVGFVGETEEDIRLTQRMIRDISAKSITVSIYTPYPGNEMVQANHLDHHLYSPHSPFNNFTQVIDNQRFTELIKETLDMADTGYVEHVDCNDEIKEAAL